VNTLSKSKSKPAVKSKVKISAAAKKYLQQSNPTGPMPAPTPPLDSAEARRQLRGF
jgi:hypothetical protein